MPFPPVDFAHTGWYSFSDLPKWMTIFSPVFFFSPNCLKKCVWVFFQFIRIQIQTKSTHCIGLIFLKSPLSFKGLFPFSLQHIYYYGIFQIEKLKDFHSEYSYTHHLDSTLDILMYLLSHTSILLSTPSFRSCHLFIGKKQVTCPIGFLTFWIWLVASLQHYLTCPSVLPDSPVN